MFGGDYDDAFDPGVYLGTYYASASGAAEEEGDFLPTVIKLLHQEFQRPSHKKGGTLLDFGSGPSIHSVISASRHYRQITLSDYSSANTQQLQRWVGRDTGAHDWGPIINHIAELEANSFEAVESRLRSSIQEIIKCDATKSNPTSNAAATASYDCITSALCLETCSKSIPEYKQTIKHVASLLKPGGIFVLIGVLGQTFYRVKEVEFFILKLSGTDITSGFEEAGFEGVELDKRSFSDPGNSEQKTSADISNFEGHKKGGTLLDFGSGPSIHSVISASRHYRQITLSDYSSANTQQLQRWVGRDTGAHDWGPIINHIAELEANSFEAVESRLRSSIQEIIKCDATKSNPTRNASASASYDCITSALCLETCSKSIPEYKQTIKHVASVLKPGGIFVLIGVLGQTFYKVKEVEFFTLKLSGADITSGFEEAGFEGIELDKRSFSDPGNSKQKTSADKSNFEGFFLMHATKK